MNPRLGSLRPYPFERLRALLAGATPPAGLHAHPAVDRRAEARAAALHRRGADRGAVVARQLSARARIAGTARSDRRAGSSVASGSRAGSVRPDDMVLPVNGTREGLFAFVQAAVDETRPEPPC